MSVVFHTKELWGDDFPDRSGICAKVSVSADFIIHGAVIEASPTADTAKGFVKM